MAKALPVKCSCIFDRSFWREQTVGGVVRVVCKRCGKWIGNKETPKEDKK